MGALRLAEQDEPPLRQVLALAFGVIADLQRLEALLLARAAFDAADGVSRAKRGLARIDWTERGL